MRRKCTRCGKPQGQHCKVCKMCTGHTPWCSKAKGKS